MVGQEGDRQGPDRQDSDRYQWVIRLRNPSKIKQGSVKRVAVRSLTDEAETGINGRFAPDIPPPSRGGQEHVLVTIIKGHFALGILQKSCHGRSRG